ncbi:ABC transporter permease [Clostridiaceae bacterium M8S5]|nr:ABC transporter permease [Clostridiaceae bacterium M8S5]
MINNTLITIFDTCKLQMKHSVVRPTYRYCLIFQPIIYTFIMYMMFKVSGQRNFVSFVVLGTGIMTLWSCICFSSAGDIQRERFMGTLQVIYATPTNFKIIMFGKILGNTILGLVPFGLSFVVVKVFFNGDVYIESPLAFIIAGVLTIVSFISISLLLAAIFTLSRSSRILMNCLEYPIYILCGILFPINILPKHIHPLSYILSPTWAVKMLRMSLTEINDWSSFYKSIVVLTIITIIYFVASNFLFDVIDKKTRKNGTLEVY